MLIDDRFKAIQKAVFQDKTVSLRPAEETVGTLGSVIRTPGAIIGTARVNFQMLSDRLVAEEYGLTVNKDALMTCSDPVGVGKGDYVQYGGAVYLVHETPSFDSHFKWLLRRTDEAVI